MEEVALPARLTPVQSPPSESLLAACCAGDREAFGRLFDCCRDRVYSIALHLSGDPATAADITQDVFMKLLTRLPQFGARAAFSTWLYRIVVNTAIDHQRSGRRNVPLPEGLLDDRLRAPLVLRHVEGLAYEEIADALGVSAGTVASRLSRAHARLARDLADLRT
jgi:RNA polymerase sigma-70 factor (ECF subfamily)